MKKPYRKEEKAEIEALQVSIDGIYKRAERAKTEALRQEELQKREEQLKLLRSNFRKSPLHRLQWEEAQQKYLILYPEGLLLC